MSSTWCYINCYCVWNISARRHKICKHLQWCLYLWKHHFWKTVLFCFMLFHLQDHVPPMHNSAPSRSRYRDTLAAALLRGVWFEKCIWKSYVNSPVSPLAPVIYWLSLPLRQQWDILKSRMSILYCMVVKNAWCFVDIPCQKPKALLHQEFRYIEVHLSVLSSTWEVRYCTFWTPFSLNALLKVATLRQVHHLEHLLSV